jgi:Arc/MetJ-type ribon-helix-helix transcriptional regulator
VTIHLPEELGRSVRSLVEGGRFASEDEAVAEAVRSFLRRQKAPPSPPGLGSIGAMRDSAEELDAALAQPPSTAATGG